MGVGVRVGVVAASALGLIALGCTSSPFACEDSTQCGGGAEDGVCELSGYCSFPDDDCPSGRRYGALAGGGLAGLCVVEDGGTGTGEPATVPPGTTSSTGSESSTAASATQPVEPPTGTSSSSGVGGEATGAPSTDSSSSTGEAIDPDLVFWLSFEDDVPDQGQANDGSGNERHALCNDGECPSIIDGPVGFAALFDGEDDHLAAPYDEGMDLDAAFTLAVWLRLDEDVGPGEFASVFGKSFGNGQFNSYEIYYWGGGGVLICGYDTPTTASTSAPLSRADGWVHVAGTFDGKLVRLYLGGDLVDSMPAKDAPRFDDHGLNVGADFDQGIWNYHWPGALDEIRLYSRALDDAEIAELAAAGD